MDFKFELTKDCVNFMLKNEIGIEFKSIEKLIEISNIIDKLGFYTSQSRNNLKVLVIYKNYKSYIFSKVIYNLKGVKEVNMVIEFKD